MDNAWGELYCHLRAQKSSPKTKEELSAASCQEKDGASDVFCYARVNSIPRRIEAVLADKGSSIPY